MSMADEIKNKVPYHLITGKWTHGKFQYWCADTMQYADQCPICLERIPGLCSIAVNDPINYPFHYTDGGIETIDFIEAKGLNYNCGNATKYISRAGKKATAERAVDIAKAIWYLQRELNTLKGK